MAQPMIPLSSTTMASTVGFPRESSTSLASTRAIDAFLQNVIQFPRFLLICLQYSLLSKKYAVFPVQLYLCVHRMEERIFL